MSRSNSGAVCDFEERAEKGASVGTTETDEARKDKEEKRMKLCTMWRWRRQQRLSRKRRKWVLRQQVMVKMEEPSTLLHVETPLTKLLLPLLSGVVHVGHAPPFHLLPPRRLQHSVQSHLQP
ncbi:uncharacterized protein LOC123499725 isoform X2 [Portunus trituberculatus]|uniref:uncharacterized protein LOC123499725 isoform X2 n=1 Tax=Portunus trituberculatus TaxID=210409 RepID=UPI001E1CB66C|nr:uncharacterized protein LOC123499725 isoform X2 [Portunus trituberculatus]